MNGFISTNSGVTVTTYREGSRWFTELPAELVKRKTWEAAGQPFGVRRATRLLDNPGRITHGAAPPHGNYLGFTFEGRLTLCIDCRTGWLSPEGRFYSCPEQAHDHLAEILVDATATDSATALLERSGWCRYKTTGPHWAGDNEPTEAQATWLMGQTSRTSA